MPAPSFAPNRALSSGQLPFRIIGSNQLSTNGPVIKNDNGALIAANCPTAAKTLPWYALGTLIWINEVKSEPVIASGGIRSVSDIPIIHTLLDIPNTMNMDEVNNTPANIGTSLLRKVNPQTVIRAPAKAPAFMKPSSHDKAKSLLLRCKMNGIANSKGPFSKKFHQVKNNANANSPLLFPVYEINSFHQNIQRGAYPIDSPYIVGSDPVLY
jgi:hypothetical protein